MGTRHRGAIGSVSKTEALEIEEAYDLEGIDF